MKEGTQTWWRVHRQTVYIRHGECTPNSDWLSVIINLNLRIQNFFSDTLS